MKTVLTIFLLLILYTPIYALDGEVYSGVYFDTNYKAFPDKNQENRLFLIGTNIQHKFNESFKIGYRIDSLSSGENLTNSVQLVGYLRYNINPNIYTELSRFDWFDVTPNPTATAPGNGHLRYFLFKVGYKWGAK